VPPGVTDAAPHTNGGATARGIIGVVGGVVLYLVVSELLETVLVAATSAERPTDIASFYAARNAPRILAAKVLYNSLTAVWAGYMAARLAGERERAYGRLAALAQTAELAYRFGLGDYASFTPLWMRAFLVLTTGPAMLAGAGVRATAREAETAGTTTAASAPPEAP
jgi:hypothetical protein